MITRYKSERLRREWTRGYYVGLFAGWLAGAGGCLLAAWHGGCF